MFLFKKRKGTTEVGFAIIAMAVLLLLGGIFVDSGPNSSSSLFKDKNDYKDKIQSNQAIIGDKGYPEETYLFYLEDTEIGRQRKVTQAFPNIDIGSKVEYNTIYTGNKFDLMANPFSRTRYVFDVNFEDGDNVNYLMLYFNFDRKSGEQNLIVQVDNLTFYNNDLTTAELPILVNKDFSGKHRARISFELDKPSWYDLFNWNKFEVDNFKVVEVRQDKSNNVKDFNFEIDQTFLERAELNVLVSCGDEREDKVGNPVKVKVNDYIIADFNPDCSKYKNQVTNEIPINILNEEKNTLTFESKDAYELSYGINEVFFNDEDVYKFTINNFNDIVDVVMYGDFDKDVLDLRINSQTLSLRRDEIKSIIPYLRFGTNEIKFLTKPVDIKEFVIEKNEFLN